MVVTVCSPMDRWRAIVNVVMNLRVPQNVGNFWTSWEPVSFSRRTRLHGASKLGNTGCLLQHTDPYMYVSLNVPFVARCTTSMISVAAVLAVCHLCSMFCCIPVPSMLFSHMRVSKYHTISVHSYFLTCRPGVTPLCYSCVFSRGIVLCWYGMVLRMFTCAVYIHFFCCLSCDILILFQSKCSKGCDVWRNASCFNFWYPFFSIGSTSHPVAASVFFLVFPPLLSFPPSYLQ